MRRQLAIRALQVRRVADAFHVHQRAGRGDAAEQRQAAEPALQPGEHAEAGVEVGHQRQLAVRLRRPAGRGRRHQEQAAAHVLVPVGAAGRAAADQVGGGLQVGARAAPKAERRMEHQPAPRPEEVRQIEDRHVADVDERVAHRPLLRGQDPQPLRFDPVVRIRRLLRRGHGRLLQHHRVVVAAGDRLTGVGKGELGLFHLLIDAAGAAVEDALPPLRVDRQTLAAEDLRAVPGRHRVDHRAGRGEAAPFAVIGDPVGADGVARSGIAIDRRHGDLSGQHQRGVAELVGPVTGRARRLDRDAAHTGRTGGTGTGRRRLVGARQPVVFPQPLLQGGPLAVVRQTEPARPRAQLGGAGGVDIGRQGLREQRIVAGRRRVLPERRGRRPDRQQRRQRQRHQQRRRRPPSRPAPCGHSAARR